MLFKNICDETQSGFPGPGRVMTILSIAIFILERVSEPPGNVKTHAAEPTPRVADSVGLGDGDKDLHF